MIKIIAFLTSLLLVAISFSMALFYSFRDAVRAEEQKIEAHNDAQIAKAFGNLAHDQDELWKALDEASKFDGELAKQVQELKMDTPGAISYTPAEDPDHISTTGWWNLREHLGMVTFSVGNKGFQTKAEAEAYYATRGPNDFIEQNP